MANKELRGAFAPQEPCLIHWILSFAYRLKVQHFFWKDQWGYVLHPNVATSSPEVTAADNRDRNRGRLSASLNSQEIDTGVETMIRFGRLRWLGLYHLWA